MKTFEEQMFGMSLHYGSLKRKREREGES